MGDVRWQRVNDEPFEYAIQKGHHGDEFVKLLDGFCLRRPLSDEIERLQIALNEACQIALGTDLTREAVERIKELRDGTHCGSRH